MIEPKFAIFTHMIEQSVNIIYDEPGYMECNHEMMKGN